MAPPQTRFAYCTQHPVLSPIEIKYIIKSMINTAKRHDFDRQNCFRRRHWEHVRKRVNTKFNHVPALTADMFLCAVRCDRTIGPAFDEEYRKARVESIIQEARRGARRAIEDMYRDDTV